MDEEILKLDSPIDVMMLMHRAFDRLSLRVEQFSARGQNGGDLTEFSESFQSWMKQLLYHVNIEDEYMTGPLLGVQAARDNETEHAALIDQGADVADYEGKGDGAAMQRTVIAAVLARDDLQHSELMDKVREVQLVLGREMGEAKVAARTRRHLYRKVLELRVLEYDHFENEEAFVLSLVRDRMSESEQLSLCRRLLIDDSAANPRWIIDWVAAELSPDEKVLLAGLEESFNVLTAR